MLTVENRRRIKVAGVLSEATPVFVSLVRNGANQTPFRVIKHDISMNLKTLAKGAISLEKGIEINRITFKTSAFADEAAVGKYLDENGFSGYSIEKSDTEFTVPGIGVESFESVAPIELSDGNVTIFAGALKGDKTAKTEGKAKWLTKKGDSVVSKFDWWLAEYSDKKTVTGVMKEALADGIPLGFGEAMQSFRVALSNVVKDNEFGSIRSLTDELGSYMTKLSEFVETNVTKTELIKEVLTKFIDEVPTETPTTPPEKTGETKPDPAPPVSGDDKVSKADYDALVTRIAALEESAKTLATKAEVEAVVKSVKDTAEVAEIVKTTLEKADQRIASVERLRQTRKSDPNSNVPDNTPPVTPPDPSKMSQAQKNMLGIRE